MIICNSPVNYAPRFLSLTKTQENITFKAKIVFAVGIVLTIVLVKIILLAIEYFRSWKRNQPWFVLNEIKVETSFEDFKKRLQLFKNELESADKKIKDNSRDEIGVRLFYTSLIDYLHRNMKYLEVEKKYEWGKDIFYPKYPHELNEIDRLRNFFHRISPQMGAPLNEKLIIEKIESIAKSFSTSQIIEGQVLQLIMRNLSKKDFNSAARVSKSWAASARKAKLSWINAHPEIPLSKFTIKSWEKIIQFCKDNKGLTSLNLSDYYGVNIDKDKFKQIIEMCPNLEHVLIHQDMDDETMELLGKLTQLKRLQIGCNDITDTGFKAITNFKKLTELYLRDGHRISTQGLKHLKELHNLQIVKIDYCPDLKGIITSLSGIKNLLAFNGCSGRFNIDNDSLRLLSTHTKLRYLNLGNSKAITDDGLIHLQDLQELEYLNLRGCKKITPAGLLHLTTLKKLKKIVLPFKRVFIQHQQSSSQPSLYDYKSQSLKHYFPSCLFD